MSQKIKVNHLLAFVQRDNLFSLLFVHFVAKMLSYPGINYSCLQANERPRWATDSASDRKLIINIWWSLILAKKTCLRQLLGAKEHEKIKTQTEHVDTIVFKIIKNFMNKLFNDLVFFFFLKDT